MFRNIIFQKHFPFWLIAFSVLIGLTLPVLLQDGMFMDALLYTSVSHNLSLGIGSFWFPQFSQINVGNLSAFHEQPPLVFGIQSLFFRIFGDSMYVERFYTFLMMFISAVLINYLWKEIFKNNSLKQLGWLPLILWITIPVCFWSYSNNMHENTMGVFTLCSVLFALKSCRMERMYYIYILLSGFFVFLATFSKGIPGFFPVTVPFLYWLVTKKIRFPKMFYQTILIVLIPLIIYSILFVIPESKESLTTYLFKRVLHRINENPTTEFRLWIIYRLFTELIPQLSFVLIFYFIYKWKKINIQTTDNIRLSIFFILVGLSGSVPLALTLVQKGFYFVPSLPFFAIGMAIIIAHWILFLVEKINISSRLFKIFIFSTSLLFIGSVTYSALQIGKTSRNKTMLHDVYIIGKSVPQKTVLSVPVETWNSWDLQCYFARYYSISLVYYFEYDFCIVDNEANSEIPSYYHKVELPTIKYSLYKREY